MNTYSRINRIRLGILAAGILWSQGASIQAAVSFLGGAAGDAASGDVTLWTRVKDEANPQATAVNVQITTDSRFLKNVTTLSAGTADAPTDYTSKVNIGN